MGYGVPDNGVDFTYVSVRDAYILMRNDRAVFVDARDAKDYEVSRVQTSFNIPANDIYFRQDTIDQKLVGHLKNLSASKTIVCLSDASITGMRNRGHVSRCRHLAQYLVECGIDRTRLVRMTGGINAWKKQCIDGILGDPRTMYNGAFCEGGGGSVAEEGLLDQGLEEAEALANARGDEFLESCSIVEPVDVVVGGDARSETVDKATMKQVFVRAFVQDMPTAYRVLRGEVFKKASIEAQKIIKLDKAVSAIIRTTGEVWEGPGGGRWAELDVGSGEKKGWVYVEGPGFGPSTCKISTKFLEA